MYVCAQPPPYTHNTHRFVCVLCVCVCYDAPCVCIDLTKNTLSSRPLLPLYTSSLLLSLHSLYSPYSPSLYSPSLSLDSTYIYICGEERGRGEGREREGGYMLCV